MAHNPDENRKTYLVRSSVLNQVLTELSETGQKQRTFVYLGSAVLAWQRQSTDNSQAVLWEHRDPSNASYRVTASGGGLAVSSLSAELDPLGNNAGLSNSIPNPQHKQTWSYPGFGSSMTSGLTCVLDGMPTPCDEVGWLLRVGGAGLCPYNNCGPQFDPKRDGPGRGGWVLPVLQDDGFSYKSVGPSTQPKGLRQPKLVPFDPNRPFDPDIEQPIHAPQNSGPCSVDTQLPESGLGYVVKSLTSRKRQYATSTTIVGLQNLAATWAVGNFFGSPGNPVTIAPIPDLTITIQLPPRLPPLRIGEISVLDGGPFGEHKGPDHAAGNGADIGLFRNDGRNLGGDYRSSTYDQLTTQRFANVLDADPDVTDYYFNDPGVTGTKLKRVTGHDDHIHVNFTRCLQ